MRAFACISLVVLLWGAAFGQSIDTPPAFDIADVHVSARTMNLNMSGGFLRAGRYEIRKATMVDLIRTAYTVDADKVLGGPSWLEADRFDVIAKAPQGATAETVKPRLQALLADRFKLVVRMDSRAMPGFALTVGKGGTAKLKQADGSGDAGCKYTMSPTQEEMMARQRAAAQAGTPL